MQKYFNTDFIFIFIFLPFYKPKTAIGIVYNYKWTATKVQMGVCKRRSSQRHKKCAFSQRMLFVKDQCLLRFLFNEDEKRGEMTRHVATWRLPIHMRSNVTPAHMDACIGRGTLAPAQTLMSSGQAAAHVYIQTVDPPPVCLNIAAIK